MNPLRFRAVAFVLVATLVLTACSRGNVAAVVHGTEISDEDLAAATPAFGEFFATLNGAVCGQSSETPPTGAEQEEACARFVLSILVHLVGATQMPASQWPSRPVDRHRMPVGAGSVRHWLSLRKS